MENLSPGIFRLLPTKLTLDITNCLEDAWLRLRFAEIVSQITRK